MDPTCGLAGMFRDLVFDQIWEQFLYLVCYGENIEQLTKKLVKLTLRRESIQHQIDEARNKVERIEPEVLHWLDEVDDIFNQAEQLHKESRAKRECSITSCPNPWLRCKLSRSAKEMAQKVADKCDEGHFERVSCHVPPQPQPELTNRVSNEGIDSRVPIMNQIMEALRNPSINTIGLCGPGGVGKTTIVKEVEMKQRNHKMFGKVIVTTISDESNIEKIQGHIAEKLGMQLNENFEDTRACRLCERLKQETNVLIILDDLWVELDLHKVGIPLVEGHKMLLTSRNETLLSKGMNCQKIIRVGVLLEDEALELFKRIAKLSVDSSNPDLISIATEIVRRCQGLPLAIATAAKALEGEDLNGWIDYLARWSSHLRRNYTGIKEVDASLKLSYDTLSQENKHIFLLSAMLSHDPSIEDLLMYSVGLDFLERIENMEEAHAGISTVVSTLKSLNLFLSGSSNHHVMIHDVFRDVALSIASDELHAFIVRHKTPREWPDEDEQERYKGICLQQSDISDFPEELHGTRLEFFLLNSTRSDLTIPSMFFKSSKELKVLAFTNMHFPLLPSLSFLKKLKALCLQSCLLEDITEVGRLKKLKILSLAYSEIQRLPVELAELTSLQVLNLAHCSKLKVIPKKLLASLKKLEVLHMRNSFDQWTVGGCSESDENASLDELVDLPISYLDIHIPDISRLPENLFLNMELKMYKIYIGKRWTWWQVNYETSKILKLELESGINLTAGLRKLLEGVEDLYLYGSNGLENVLQIVKGFSCLRHLHVEDNHDIKCVVLNSAHRGNAFPILESLKLKNLKALEKLCEGPNDIIFRQLRTLKIENLSALTGEFSIIEIGTDNASGKTVNSLFNKKVLLPKLEVLELSNLNRLIPLIWAHRLSHNSFSDLKTLIVERCGFVKLMPLHVLKSLNNLEEVEVRECDMMKIVFDFEDLNDYKEIVSSSVVVPLKRLKLWKLTKLKKVWSNHCQGNVSFPSLRSVDVSYCKSLTSIFPALSISKGMLGDLEELQISNCSSIDVIVARDQVSEPGGDVAFKFPRLTSLKLSFLPKLRNFYPKRHTIEWSHLQRLSIAYCDELAIFKKEVSSPSEIFEEESTLNSKYPLLSCHDKAIGSLEELRLKGKKVVGMIGSGRLPMYHFLKVKLLQLSTKKATTISYISLLKSFPCLEELELRGDFKDDVTAPTATFSKLTLACISSMISLKPSLVSSPNLTHLVVTSLKKLTTLMTSSTARSLVHVTCLSIRNCKTIEEIITKQEGEDDEEQEIIFCKLELLELDDLPRLRIFCRLNYTFKFPFLDKLIIKKCPKFKIFSPGLADTPSLRSVQLWQDWRKHHEIWDTNLNKTFYHQRFGSSRELVLDEDDAIMIRNDQFPADWCPQVEILVIEGFGFVDEWVTFPYTLLERFPKLNQLHVKNCSFEEIFPSHVPSFTSFHNLILLKVSKCHELVYLVTCSTVNKSLLNLKTLEINDCKNMEEIVMNDANEDVESGITFKELRRIELTDMPSLKVFSSQSHTFRFPELQEIQITGCPKMKMFCQGVLETPKFSKMKIEEDDMEWKDEGDLNKTIEMLSPAKDSFNV